jgi:diaminopimelate epimerase
VSDRPAVLRRSTPAASRTARAPRSTRCQVRNATAVDFVKLSPASNTTVLVTSRHPETRYLAIADRLLRAEHVHAEQVGFILPPRKRQAHTRLHMAGDEFCANATLFLAAWHAATSPGPDRAELLIETSGARQALHCRVEPSEAGYRCELSIPWPQSIEPYKVPGIERAGLVRYPGAVHLVAEGDGSDPLLRERAQQLAVELGAREAVCVVGIMLYDRHRQELAPLVSVPALGSMIWEGSCGSGTAAVGAYLAASTGTPINASVKQPGGTTQVFVDSSRAEATALRICTEVNIVAEGTAYIHD